MKQKSILYRVLLPVAAICLSSCVLPLDPVSKPSEPGGNSSPMVPSTGEPSLPDSPSTKPTTNPGLSLPSVDLEGYHLMFQDEFDGNTLSSQYWNLETGTGSNYGLTDWGNNEKQYYLPENASVRNGNLVIEAKRQAYGGKNYTSARIQTRDKIHGTYGYIEARMKLPVGTGLWPAFWLLPNDTKYGGWASSGEIDVMEARGRLPNQVDHTLHFGGPWPRNVYESRKTIFNGTIADYHVYGVEWSSEGFYFYVDDLPPCRLLNDIYYSEQDPNNPSAPFDVDFYLLFNFAIGGNFDENREPDANFTSATMEVDYVRWYQKDA